MKQCTLCKQHKALDEYRKDPRGKDGYVARCKKCCSAKIMERRRANPDAQRAANEASKRWREKNPEKVSAQRHRHYWKHAAEKRLKASEYRANNPDTAYAAVKRWKAENRERVLGLTGPPISFRAAGSATPARERKPN